MIEELIILILLIVILFLLIPEKTEQETETRSNTRLKTLTGTKVLVQYDKEDDVYVLKYVFNDNNIRQVGRGRSMSKALRDLADEIDRV